MIRLIKWNYKNWDITGQLPATFLLNASKFIFVFSKFEGGMSASIGYHHLYELQIISKSKRPDLIDFGFTNANYKEFGGRKDPQE